MFLYSGVGEVEGGWGGVGGYQNHTGQLQCIAGRAVGEEPSRKAEGPLMHVMSARHSKAPLIRADRFNRRRASKRASDYG